MFYGTYEGFEKLEICEFDTKLELESWLRYEDEFAQAFEPEKSGRKELKDERIIQYFLHNPNVIRATGLDGYRWLLFRPGR